MAPVSSIPLFGLPHRIDIVKRVINDDGYGGIAVGVIDEVIACNVKCRATVLTAMEEQQGFGDTTGNRWKITAKPVECVEIGYSVQVTDGSRLALLDRCVMYRILHSKLEIDHNGRLHHLQLIVLKTSDDRLNTGVSYGSGSGSGS